MNIFVVYTFLSLHLYAFSSQTWTLDKLLVYENGGKNSYFKKVTRIGNLKNVTYSIARGH